MKETRLADISSWQPTQIDWPAYAEWSSRIYDDDGNVIGHDPRQSKIILRASQGVGDPDQDFEVFWKAAVAAGIYTIGVYHYAYPNLQPGSAGAIAEANYFNSVVGRRLRAQDFLMLDYEQNVSEATAGWALTWLQQTEKNFGRLPKIYSYQSFIAEKLQDARLTRYPLVYARWTFDPNSRPPAPPPWASYEILQYSDKGVVPGIPGNVDVDVFIMGPSAASPATMKGSRMLLQHPVDNGRLDILYVGTDGAVYHNWNNGDGAAGLCADAPKNTANLGAPKEGLTPLSLSAAWDNTGQYINIVAVGKTGALYAKTLKAGGTAVDMDWTPITGQAALLSAPEQEAARVTAIENELSKVKADLN
jgi:GH25 family lysozyme M1 (1,4-beta-N-acetylmuramidase)